MFSGIVESKARLVDCTLENQTLTRLKIERPATFQDIKIGDSIAVNGVCLTVDRFDSETFEVVMAQETMQVTGWNCANLQGKELNLERSLSASDRIHGHPTTGHVDAMVTVEKIENQGGSVILTLNLPPGLKKYVWAKGSLAVNGTSLTINKTADGIVEFCLIPETIRRTNLGQLEPGDRVTVEVDAMARGLIHFLETERPATL